MSPSRQRGASLIIVLVMLAVLLLGALSMFRLVEANNLVAGNMAFKDTAQQASEVGISEAFDALATLTHEEHNQGNWYYASIQGDEPSGLPSSIDWAATSSVQVGKFDVHFIVERQCTGAMPVVDVKAQCIIKLNQEIASAKAGLEVFESSISKLYRITVFVNGPKNTTAFVQSMVVR